MSKNNSDQSVESSSEDNIFTSQNTKNILKRNSDLKEVKKELINLSNPISVDEELLKNKLLTTNEMDNPLIEKININDKNLTEKKQNSGLSLSPIKKKSKKNMLVDLMEKSKKNNDRRRSVMLFATEELKLKEENTKHVRKDAFGVPINKRNKKRIKVTFIDTVNNKKEFAEIITIPSYKKYNFIEGPPREEDKITNKSNCKCCLII